MSILSASLPALLANVKSWPPHCSAVGCPTKSLLRAVSRRKEGIRVGADWYCCSECFEQMAAKRLLQLSNRQSSNPSVRPSRMPMGLLLLSRGQITVDQLRTALEKQQHTGIRIGEILIELGFATEQQVTSAVAAQWGCPVFQYNHNVAAVPFRLPHTLQRRHGVVPVHFAANGRRLMLGFVDRIDYATLNAVEVMTETTATPCFVTPTDYESHLVGQGECREENEIVFEQPSSPAEMGRIARSYAEQINAREAFFQSCGVYLWVRLRNWHRELDLLFHRIEA